MKLYAIMNGPEPMQFGAGPVVPEDAVFLGEGFDISPWVNRVLIEGVWQDRVPLSEPEMVQDDRGYVLTFAGVPVGAVVQVFDLEAAEILVVMPIEDGTAEIVLSEPGSYEVEVKSPAPTAFWSRVVTWPV